MFNKTLILSQLTIPNNEKCNMSKSAFPGTLTARKVVTHVRVESKAYQVLCLVPKLHLHYRSVKRKIKI